MKERREVIGFCKRAGITLAQFYGEEAIKGSLHLNSLTSIPEGFNLTVGGSLYLDSLTSIPEHLKPENLQRPPAVLQWEDGKYISIDGIFMEVIHKRGNIYQGKSLDNNDLSFVYGDGKTFAHGKTLKEAKADFDIKIAKRQGIQEAVERIKQSQSVTPQDYRLITGACQFGIQEFMIRNGLEGTQSLTLSKILEITEGHYGHEQFKKLFV